MMNTFFNHSVTSSYRQNNNVLIISVLAETKVILLAEKVKKTISHDEEVRP